MKQADRRRVLAGAAALGGLALAPWGRTGRTAAADPDVSWGVCGHPFLAYPGISIPEQLEALAALGLTRYRIDTRRDGSIPALEDLLNQAGQRRIAVLPIIEPEMDLDEDAPRLLKERAFEHGRMMARRFRGEVPVWELANELENFAILQPCEMRDDGTKYPCEWGPAGGVGPLEYYGPRWRKVSAVLAGLSAGVAEGDPAAKRAMGTAGWGHLGAFDRLVEDGVTWDITVWHDYEGVSEDYLNKLASLGRPIWITEFNAGGGGDVAPEVNAARLVERIAYYRRMRSRFRLEAAFIYELLDETYWGDTFEARMGLMSIAPRGEGGWRIQGPKPAATAVRDAIAQGR